MAEAIVSTNESPGVLALLALMEDAEDAVAHVLATAE